MNEEITALRKNARESILLNLSQRCIELRPQAIIINSSMKRLLQEALAETFGAEIAAASITEMFMGIPVVSCNHIKEDFLFAYPVRDDK